MCIVFLISALFLSASCLSQDLTNEKQLNNLFSIAAGVTPTTVGVTYERILKNRKASFEIEVEVRLVRASWAGWSVVRGGLAI